MLENRDVNITTQLARFFKAFEDYVFMQRLRGEMEGIKYYYLINKNCTNPQNNGDKMAVTKKIAIFTKSEPKGL